MKVYGGSWNLPGIADMVNPFNAQLTSEGVDDVETFGAPVAQTVQTPAAPVAAPCMNVPVALDFQSETPLPGPATGKTTT